MTEQEINEKLTSDKVIEGILADIDRVDRIRAAFQQDHPEYSNNAVGVNRNGHIYVYTNIPVYCDGWRLEFDYSHID